MTKRPPALELVVRADPLPDEDRVDALVPVAWRERLLARIVAEPASPPRRLALLPAAPSRRRPRARVRLLVGLAALALAATGAAIAVGVDLVLQQERLHTGADHPQRRGPAVRIAGGDDWALVAWNSDAGICLDLAIVGNSPFSCGFPVRGAMPPADDSGAGPPTHAVAGFVSGGGLVGGDDRASIFGVAASDVAKVEVELRDGRVVAAPLYDSSPELGVDVRFFVVRLLLPPQQLTGDGPVSAFLAYDSRGDVIERAAD